MSLEKEIFENAVLISEATDESDDDTGSYTSTSDDDQPTEIWKKIEHYNNYCVSTFGRVKNIRTDKILKPNTDHDGYFYVGLYKNGKPKFKKIHRIVADAFLDNPLNKRCVDHIDRNQKNNAVENLRWATSSENCQNKKIQKNNSSGYPGVIWNKRDNKWYAYIFIDKKKKYLGSFDNLTDAVIKRKEFELIIYKEFRRIDNN